MKNLLLELALPRTDAGVLVQTVVMAIFWTAVIIAVHVRRMRREYRTFVIGVAVINFAWFAVRAVH